MPMKSTPFQKPRFVFINIKVIILFLFAGAIFSACAPDPGAITRRTQFLMGTLAEITVRGPDDSNTNSAISQAFDEMARVEALMSRYIPDSEISRLNRGAGGESLKVSRDTLEVIQRAVYWAERTGGAFDITIGPAANLWDWDEENQEVPSPGQLKDALKLVSYKNIQIEGGEIKLAQKGMSLQLGAIAKGYAVDRAIESLKASGIQNAMVNAGGDLRTLGRREKDRLWKIGLQHPRNPQAIVASFALENRAVATSGDYQKYFVRDGVRYHHILNPDTGRPAEGVVSATVIAETAMDADALATAVFVLGPEKGIEWIESLAETEAMILAPSGPPHFSKGFQSLPQFALEGFKNELAH